MRPMAGETGNAPFAARGVHHATINGHRFHLRPTREGGLLWLDGRQPPYLLDATAREFVRLLIHAMWQFQQGDGDESEQVIRFVVEGMLAKYRRPLAFRFTVTRERVTQDLHRLFGTLMELAHGACPAEAGLSAKALRPEAWTAPARMDLALTYRCNLDCPKCYNGGDTPGEELTTAQWQEIFATLWRVGIPHLVFTGGEPTLRDDLVTLVRHAEQFVTGLVTNGTRLAELAGPLREASLDYTQVTIESYQPEVHDALTRVPGSHALTAAGIAKAREVGMQVVTNTTLTVHNAAGFSETLRWLHATFGVEHMACNTVICSGRGTRYRESDGLGEAALREVLQGACATAKELGVELQWYSPGCYATVDPVALGFGPKSCSAAAHNMLIRPDGAVLPCQSWPDPVGSILSDRWEKIWNHETCRKLRDHKYADAACQGCGFFAVCGGGCPLDHSPRRQPGGGGAA